MTVGFGSNAESPGLATDLIATSQRLAVTIGIRNPQHCRCATGIAPVNSKHFYRLMKRHGLLLAGHTGRRRPREHDGQVATLRTNIRWCSDALEFTCWNGEVVRVAFAIDCHDGEVINWVATTAGISGELIRDMMVVEKRFGMMLAPHPVQCSPTTDQFSPLIGRRDRPGAQSGAVLHAGRKPGEQRYGRGLRENLKRDYVRVSPIPNAAAEICASQDQDRRW